MSTPPKHVGPAELAGFAFALREDTGEDPRVLFQRDAQLARQLGPAADSPAGWLRWLDHAGSPEAQQARLRAASAVALAQVVAVALGLLVGYGSARVVFAYRGDDPINVVEALLVYAGLNALTLFLAGLAGAPASWRLRVPGLAALGDALALLSPGRLAGAALRLAPPDHRKAGHALLDSAHGHTPGVGAGTPWSGAVARWCVLTWSQWMALAFHVGAVAGFVQFVVFSDLAFGWSTTLNVTDAGFATLIDWLSLPWAWAWPAAAPGLELVAGSRFYRGKPSADPQSVQGWWRFLLMAMLVYGLAPRAVALLAARWRLGLAAQEALTLLPGYAGLKARLRARAGATTSDASAALKAPKDARTFSAVPAETPTDTPDNTPDNTPAEAEASPMAMRWFAVNWAEAPLRDDTLGATLGLEVAGVAHAGLGGLDADAQAIARAVQACAQTDPPVDGVALLVKEWEPPTAEMIDFLADLRRSLGPGRPIQVRLIQARSAQVQPGPGVALGVSNPGSASPTPADAARRAERLADWDRKLRALGDRWTARFDAFDTSGLPTAPGATAADAVEPTP
ncbi:MAG: DUF2868 domain-containing protein [Planctomycetota bacterium]